ncbi:substrate-binding periplasmic protein [Colwellia psychrerythraea]|uniref:ABC-type transporter, periplasmic subunit family 3 n=1 Tax=Colwellia psychrerythraea TaxID=28229 RepID=A0A099KD06_COLPS|nr:transporter substrate-binding domain-containing protein [Colwellia psychrerythraea]KGJ88190.1 ABC-type transporter, periplasmic subunit family 3 [Colwellia psychrerythraea]
MKISRAIATILMLLSTLSFSLEHNSISLVSPYFPPYTYEQKQEVIGIGPEFIKRIFANINIRYKITMVADYGAAVHVMKENLADGMFLASQNAERDAIAQFSQPLMINKWSWFILKDSEIDVRSEVFKSQAGIGTIKGTNTSKWLKQNAYSVIAQPTNAGVLIAMLKSHRIDAAFVADAVFEHELDVKELSKFTKVVEVKKPFGIYISHYYLKKHPDLLEQINSSIKLLKQGNKG